MEQLGGKEWISNLKLYASDVDDLKSGRELSDVVIQDFTRAFLSSAKCNCICLTALISRQWS